MADTLQERPITSIDAPDATQSSAESYGAQPQADPEAMHDFAKYMLGRLLVVGTFATVLIYFASHPRW